MFKTSLLLLNFCLCVYILSVHNLYSLHRLLIVILFIYFSIILSSTMASVHDGLEDSMVKLPYTIKIFTSWDFVLSDAEPVKRRKFIIYKDLVVSISCICLQPTTIKFVLNHWSVSS